jgi:hypothetical protein
MANKSNLNRLNLNFKLETQPERVQFVNTYLNSIPFKPTPSELDIIAKYILWGKNPATNLNGSQEGLELETRHKTWDPKRLESLDALIESPAFSEALLRSPSDPPTKLSSEPFSRSSARKTAPPHILSSLESLWREIDETELLINFYDLAHGKRKTQPRPQLLKRFSTPDITSISTRADSLQPYTYLKLRHKLVDLRREQYTLRDEYAPQVPSNPTFTYKDETPPTFGEEIEVKPVGIPKNDQSFYSKVFNPTRYPNPNDFSQSELVELSKLLWEPAHSTQDSRFFDFRNTDHLYKLFTNLNILEDEVEEAGLESGLPYFLRAASMYRTLAALDPIQSDILDLKIQKRLNQDIADYINKKYGKNYQANYISTLYCKKCLGKIAEAALRHREILENLFFPENFKKCKDCGEILLRDEENFMRRHRSGDGFSPRCKKCEKIIRDKRKK